MVHLAFFHEGNAIALIPEDAVEVINDVWETGARMRASYFVDGQEIGWRYFDVSGVLLMEYEMQNGKRNGRHRDWHDNGQLCEEGSYVDDKEHGETKQYDENGRQIGSYVMDHGTGIDLWFYSPGVLSEEREYHDGKRHGFERWWNLDNRTVGEECHYWNDLEHGIVRRWNRRGKLTRSFPKYYVMGKQVTKRQYERACRSDSTLPSFVASDNLPERQLPEVVLRMIVQVDPQEACSAYSPVRPPHGE
jgi:antitoxin component YwqK of YwqJK toxin-antitoxin module